MTLSAFELAALGEGFGTCWAGYAMMLPGIEHRLKLPVRHRVFGAMMVGTPGHVYRRIPVRRTAPVEWVL
ncbi:MAG: hypothetical protein JW940_07840, partial [Polyangiaceae bacterium]|nr:hypothetical protein [Polyangiaceae bacterium]